MSQNFEKIDDNANNAKLNVSKDVVAIDIFTTVSVDDFDDHHEDFENLFKEKIQRSEHLSVTHSNDNQIFEISTLNKMNSKICQIKFRLIFDRKYSYIEITTKISKNDNHFDSRFEIQIFKLRFSIKFIFNFRFLNVKKIDALNKLSFEFAKIKFVIEYVKTKKFHVLIIRYESKKVINENLDSSIYFKIFEKVRCLETFRQIYKSTKIQFYMQLQSSHRFDDFLKTLKLKFSYETQRAFFNEYRSRKIDKIVLQWNLENFDFDVDIYARTSFKTFDNMNAYKVTMNYDIMRDFIQQFKWVLKTLDNVMKVIFYVVFDCHIVDDLFSKYFAFVNCQNEKLIREMYNVDDENILNFVKTLSDSSIVEWKYRINFDISNINAFDNLMMKIFRNKLDKRNFFVNKTIFADMKFLIVWKFSEMSNKTSRRFINCINEMCNIKKFEANIFRQYVMKRNFSKNFKSNSFAEIKNENNIIEIQQIFDSMISAQKNMWKAIRDSKLYLSFVQKSSETEKIDDVVKMREILSNLNISWIQLSFSNVVVNANAERYNATFLEHVVIRDFQILNANYVIQRTKKTHRDEEKILSKDFIDHVLKSIDRDIAKSMQTYASIFSRDYREIIIFVDDDIDIAFQSIINFIVVVHVDIRQSTQRNLFKTLKQIENISEHQRNLSAEQLHRIMMKIYVNWNKILRLDVITNDLDSVLFETLNEDIAKESISIVWILWNESSLKFINFSFRFVDVESKLEANHVQNTLKNQKKNDQNAFALIVAIVQNSNWKNVERKRSNAKIMSFHVRTLQNIEIVKH